MEKEKIKLSGFNNLTKVLSFNLYDFCIAFSDEERGQYVNYIHDRYSAKKITEISCEIVKAIDAQILSVSSQDYDPVGASSMVLMSDLKGGGSPIPTAQVSLHLDKSHITVHTYPDASDPDGICSFRVDIDISTCGEIVPLDAINYLFDVFECDVTYIDYIVRGYTRLADGKKIYNDHQFNSIQDFIRPKIKSNYTYLSDINMPQDNTWQTKMMIKQLGPETYLLNPEDIKHPQLPEKMKLLREEMKEVYYMIH